MDRFMKFVKFTGYDSIGDYKFKTAEFKCRYCGSVVERRLSVGNMMKYCSRKCASIHRLRKPFKKKVMISGYWYKLKKKHPRATKKGYVAEHVLVMEEHIKRHLQKNEVVHHIDEVKTNNDISNLELMTVSEHMRHHALNRKRSENGKFK